MKLFEPKAFSLVRALSKQAAKQLLVLGANSRACFGANRVLKMYWLCAAFTPAADSGLFGKTASSATLHAAMTFDWLRNRRNLSCAPVEPVSAFQLGFVQSLSASDST